jgi:hypothetical protein
VLAAKAYMPPPGVPLHLKAAVNGDGTISLSWGPPTGCADCWYDVSYLDATGKQKKFMTYLDKGTTARLTYLANKHTYEIRVGATDPGGVGPATPAVFATPRLPLPGAPQDFQVVTNTDGSMDLSWKRPAGCPDCGYLVYYRDVRENPQFMSFPYAGTSVPLRYLTPGHTYEVKVSATDLAGPGPATASVTVAIALSSPSAPRDLAVDPGNGEITVTWAAPSSGCPCYYYVYYRNDSPGQRAFTGYLDRTTTAQIRGLANGALYDVHVTAINSNNGPQGPASAAAVTTPREAPPSAPTGLTATARGDGSIGLSWKPPSSGCPCWYLVYYRDAANGDGYTSYLDMTGPNADLTYLNIGHVYDAYVEATNAGGDSPPSNTASATAYEPPPSAPTLTSVIAQPDGETADLSWKPPTSGCPCWYVVYYRDVSASGPWQSYLDTSTSAELTFLTTDNEYQVHVAATNAGGTGPGTPPVTFDTAIPAPRLAGWGGPGGVALGWVAANPKGALIRQSITVASYTAPATAAIAVTLRYTGKSKGAVKITPADQSCSATCTVAVPAGQSETLTPMPAKGSRFAWTGGLCTGSGPCKLTLTGLTSVTGTFS